MVADLTDDCIVDYEDLEIIANEWLTGGIKADLNHDGYVNLNDYSEWALWYYWWPYIRLWDFFDCRWWCPGGCEFYLPGTPLTPVKINLPGDGNSLPASTEVNLTCEESKDTDVCLWCGGWPRKKFKAQSLKCNPP
jgi:hypothetical protein